MNRVFITGDIHGLIDLHKLPVYFEHKKNLDKQDYLIICGDAGIVWDGQNQDGKVQSVLHDLPVTTLFVDGNHENFTRLNDYPVEKWHGGKVHFIQDDIIHLMRGQVYTIAGHMFFTFGGAHSVDWYQRTEGISWWKEEIPNDYEMMEGYNHLIKVNHNVDYIITHTAPYEVLAEMGMDISEEEETFSQYLDRIREEVNFKDWYFGHLHFDEDLEKFHCVFERVVELKEDYDSICNG